MLNKGDYLQEGYMVFYSIVFQISKVPNVLIVSSVYKGVHPCSSLSLLCYGLGKVCRITPPTQSSKLHCTLLLALFLLFLSLSLFFCCC